MFIEGDIFKIENKEYKLRLINVHSQCWLESVLDRNAVYCISGGLNKIYHIKELINFERITNTNFIKED
jgi:hypothetical protein